ncbi:MAG: hypothetical protein ACPGXK_05835 [Phycisphaerae bacterium]
MADFFARLIQRIGVRFCAIDKLARSIEISARVPLNFYSVNKIIGASFKKSAKKPAFYRALEPALTF